jgi:UDP-N-acetylglucosamine 2-epimerase
MKRCIDNILSEEKRMKRLKLMTIVGTRPELIRLSQVIKKADLYFEHIFVHTGQNYDDRLNEIFYEDLAIRRPDFFLNVTGKNLGETLGNIISRSYDLMRCEKPDALLILGDTNSALSAISAKRLKIPVFHMEAGNRCFDENLPEEINRRIVDHISDIHLPYTEHARRYLLAEGVRKEHIYVTGSPLREVISANEEKINGSMILNQLGITENQYILLSAHREENIDNEKNFYLFMTAINDLAEKYQIPIMYSVHPRSAKMIEDRKFTFHHLVKKMRPFKFSDYSKLMRKAFCVVSDSGTIPEEAAISKFPAVCIRTSTERPEALDKGSFIIGGIGSESILQSVEIAVNMGVPNHEVTDYMDYNVSEKVIKIIQSYTPIVNERIWGKI